MADRIDHAAESQKIWDHVGEGFISEEGWTEATAIMGVLDALRHATLALVEQQRIANLIAWTTANGDEPTDAAINEIDKGLNR